MNDSVKTAIAKVSGALLAAAVVAAAPRHAAAQGRSKYVNELPKWYEYAVAVKQADIEKAQAVRKQLDSVFNTAEARAEFWNTMIAPARQHTLRLFRVCDKCTDGKCAKCAGSGKCWFCNGTKKCPVCSGFGVTTKKCEKCACPTCKGTGFCQTCLGRGKVTCPVCHGTGGRQSEKEIQCEKCKGSGKLAGGIEGDLLRPCPYCKGKGVKYAAEFKPCETCGGTKTVACKVCKGSGMCSDCGGKKKTAGCKACGGTGTITTECPTCRKSGICPECQGWGKCGPCEGKGICAVCRGTGVLHTDDVLADSKWIRWPGCVAVEDTSKFTLGGKKLEPAAGGSGPGLVKGEQADLLKRGSCSPGLKPAKSETICVSQAGKFGWLKGFVLE